jgi:ABC-type polysaccharide/polyol phosphate export permease
MVIIKIMGIIYKSTSPMRNKKDLLFFSLAIPFLQTMFFLLIRRMYSSEFTLEEIILNNIIYAQYTQIIINSAISVSRDREIMSLRDIFLSKMGFIKISVIRTFLNSMVSFFFTALLILIFFIIFSLKIILNQIIFLIVTILIAFSFLSLFSVFWGVIGMKYKETIFIVNVFLIIQLLISGINFPLGKLPSLFIIISRFMPLPYLIEGISSREFNEQWFISISSLATLSILFFIISIMIFRLTKKLITT